MQAVDGGPFVANYLDDSISLEQQAIDAQNPWLGLHAFTEELHQFFYGRDREAEELFRRVNRKSLTILFGQSGLGKTSLLRAGLFPRLRRAGFFPVSIRLDHTPQAPESSVQIIAALHAAATVADAALQGPGPTSGTTLWEYFHRVDFALRAATGQSLVPVLVFDQFEEVFTRGRETEALRERSATLLTELADLVENRPPQELVARFDADPNLVEQFDFSRSDYRILICLREDYLAMLEDMRQRMPSLSENRMRLTRMNGEQAFDAVSRPGGHLMSPSVSRQIVKFVAQSASALRHASNGESSGLDDDLSLLEVEPALLSLFCAELNNRRLAQGLREITSDLLAGSRETILRDYYERCMLQTHPEVRRFIEDELLTESGYRENIALETAQRRLAQHGAPEDALEELVRQRLLHIEERLHVRRIELTHDVLTDVVRQSRDQRQRHEEAAQARRREEQVRLQLRQSRRRLIVVASVMAAFLAIVSGFGLFSYYQWQEAKRLRDVAAKAEARANDRAKAAENLEEMAREYMGDASYDLYQIALEHPTVLRTYLNFMERSIGKFERILAVNPQASWAQQQRVYFLAFSGEAAEKLNDRKAAVDYASKALEAARGLPDESDALKPIVLSSGIVASYLRHLEEYELASQALQTAFEGLHRADPEHNADWAWREAMVYQVQGELAAAQSKWRESLQAYKHAIALHTHWLEQQPHDSRLRNDLVDFRIGAADAHLKLDAVDQALSELELAKKFGLELWKEADSIKARNQVAYLFEKLGWAYRTAKNLDQARMAYENALRARRGVFVQTPGVLPEDFVYNPETNSRNLAVSLRLLGSMEYELGDPKIAKSKYEEALQIARQWRERIPNFPNLKTLCDVLESWGNDLYSRKAWVEAEKRYREALELREVAVKERSDDAGAKRQLAYVLARLASTLFAEERWRDALLLTERRVELRRAAHQALDTYSTRAELSNALGSLSYYYLFDKRPQEARTAAVEALQLQPDATWIRTNLAHALLFTDYFEEAAKIYQEYANKELGSMTFAEECRNDFRLFRKAGNNDPRMAQIEALLPPERQQAADPAVPVDNSSAQDASSAPPASSSEKPPADIPASE